MRKINPGFAAILLLSAVAFVQAQSADVPRYQLPPKEIVDAFDAQPLPAALLSPTKQMFALTYRHPYPTIAELSQPILRIAGARVNPRNNGPQRAQEVYAITLRRIADGSETKVGLPPGANISNVHFSPDGAQLSFINRKDDRLELWLADATTGKTRMISGTDRLNATTGDPCDWLRDNKTLICQFVPVGRGPAPAEPTVPVGPNIQET